MSQHPEQRSTKSSDKSKSGKSDTASGGHGNAPVKRVVLVNMAVISIIKAEPCSALIFTFDIQF